MSEKKHIFKVEVDDQNFVFQRGDNGWKHYGIKLIGKNGEEVVLNQPYAATYSIWGEEFNYVIPEDNIATMKSIKLDNAVIDIILGDKNSGYKFVLKDKSKEDDDGTIIPRGSWYFHDQNINLTDYKQLYIDDYIDFTANGNCTGHIKLTDASGSHILSLMTTNGTVSSGNRSVSLVYREGQKQLEEAPAYVTVLEGYKNANNKPLIVYYSDKNGNPIINDKAQDGMLQPEGYLEYNLSDCFSGDQNRALENVLLTTSNLLDVISQQNDLELLTHPTDSQLQTLLEHLPDDKLVNIFDKLDTSKLQTIADKLPDSKAKTICDNIFNELEQCKAAKAEIILALEDCNRFVGGEVWE